MAQTIKLKRSATQGKVPSTGNLALGELAINTYDGRVFFKKNDGSDSIEHIVTTDSITTGSVSIIGSLVVDDITIDGSTISDSGDLTLDIGGDLNIDVDGTDIILKDGGTAFGRFKRDSSDFIIKSEANNEDIILRGQDGGSTIDALTLDMSEAGAASFNSTISATGATFSSLSSATEATSVMINGSNQLVTRELGSNAFNSTAFTTNTGTVTSVAVTVGSGLDVSGSPITTSGTIDIDLDLTEITLGAGLDSTTTGLSLDLSELTDMTGGVDSDETELILLDNGTESRKAIGEIDLSQFDNGTSGFISSFDITTQTDSKYLRSNATDTATGVITFSNTTNSTSKTTGGVKISGGVGIAKTLNVGEDVVAFASSDERYKDNIIPIRNPNEKIKQIGGYTFDWNDKHEVFKGKKDIGVIAQEVEKVLPEIVETRDNGFKAVKYEKIVALLIESNKELIKRVEELESKVK